MDSRKFSEQYPPFSFKEFAFSRMEMEATRMLDRLNRP